MTPVTEQLRCMACGQQGPDVRVTLVDLDAEGEELRRIDVPIANAYDIRGRILGFAYIRATERYVHEPRCPDYNPRRLGPGERSSCLERIRQQEAALRAPEASQAAPPVAAESAKEVPTWMPR